MERSCSAPTSWLAELFSRSWKKIARGILAEVYTESLPPADAATTVRIALSQLGSIPVAATPTGLRGNPTRSRISQSCDRLESKVYHLLVVGGLTGPRVTGCRLAINLLTFLALRCKEKTTCLR